MFLSFIKNWPNFDEITEALTDEEKGRLLLAMIRYAQGGEEPQLAGLERVLWPVFRADIDHDLAVYQTKIDNGKQPKRKKAKESEKNQTEADGSETKRMEADKSETKRMEADFIPLFEEKESEREREQEERTKEEIEKEKEKEKERGNARADAQSVEPFDRFWSAYPRKEGKKAARKAWEKIRPGPRIVVEIMAGLQKQKNSDQWRRDGGQFIPHPATWLNGERWKDETLPARAGPVVPVQNYSQRDYKDEDEEIRQRMFAAVKAGEG